MYNPYSAPREIMTRSAKRIEELETENRRLKKLAVDVITALESVEKAKKTLKKMLAKQ